MKEVKWRFPGNNFGDENGLDTPAMETFKGDPISSLAREMCQNSIDARNNRALPVKITFDLFNITNEQLPGCNDLEKQIKSCYDYRKTKSGQIKITEQLDIMLDSVRKNNICCLRISDFNTTGLLGVGNEIIDDTCPWYLNTKGSGITSKTGNKAGSKGIGKYAAFVMSEFNTVFYSTYTKNNERGYEGICKLCSAPLGTEGEKTQGTGYFSVDVKNNPIQGELFLDSDFQRKENEFGTDVFILGFKKEANWKKGIISKILESFMCAIYFGDLEIEIDNTIISKETLKDIVYSSELVANSTPNEKKVRKSIVSQYILLTDKEVYEEQIMIDDYGDARLIIKSFKKAEMDLSTGECVMIRFPYMMIKPLPRVSDLPCSAMCIINDNNLNAILREVENPQHTDWQVSHIEDPSRRQEASRVIKELRDKIVSVISDYLLTGENTQTDLEGAGDYLPDNTKDDDGESGDSKILEKATMTKPIRNKIKERTGANESDNGNVPQPEIGSHTDGENSPVPEGNNDAKGGKPRDSDKEQAPTEGEKDILKYAQLTGISYKYFVIKKDKGLYGIVFSSPYNEASCELELYYLDDTGNKYPVLLKSCNEKGKGLNIKNNKSVCMSLEIGKKYYLEIETDQKDLFASEVKIYACR